jgi:hypothetical protein
MTDLKVSDLTIRRVFDQAVEDVEVPADILAAMREAMVEQAERMLVAIITGNDLILAPGNKFA